MTRHDAREQAFLVMFEKIFNNEEKISEIIVKAEENDLIKLNGFSKDVLLKYEEKCDEVDNAISEHLKDWTLQRLPKVSLAVLRLAATEIMFCEDTPNGVAANEAVELAKKFGTVDDASYINGVLGSLIKSL